MYTNIRERRVMNKIMALLEQPGDHAATLARLDIALKRAHGKGRNYQWRCVNDVVHGLIVGQSRETCRSLSASCGWEPKVENWLQRDGGNFVEVNPPIAAINRVARKPKPPRTPFYWTRELPWLRNYAIEFAGYEGMLSELDRHASSGNTAFFSQANEVLSKLFDELHRRVPSLTWAEDVWMRMPTPFGWRTSTSWPSMRMVIPGPAPVYPPKTERSRYAPVLCPRCDHHYPFYYFTDGICDSCHSDDLDARPAEDRLPKDERERRAEAWYRNHPSCPRSTRVDDETGPLTAIESADMLFANREAFTKEYGNLIKTEAKLTADEFRALWLVRYGPFPQDQLRVMMGHKSSGSLRTQARRAERKIISAGYPAPPKPSKLIVHTHDPRNLMRSIRKTAAGYHTYKPLPGRHHSMGGEYTVSEVRYEGGRSTKLLERVMCHEITGVGDMAGDSRREVASETNAFFDRMFSVNPRLFRRKVESVAVGSL